MDKYFFSKKNIDRLYNILESNIPVKNTPESKKTCRNFLEKQMEEVLNKYGDKKPKSMPMPVFLEKLNKKSISECIKMYEKKTGVRHDPDKMNRIRDEEVNGKRQPTVPRRPEHTNGGKKRNEGFTGLMDGGVAGGFATVNQMEYIDKLGLKGDEENPPFISATGSVEPRMFFGNINDNANFGNKRSSYDDLEQRMLERQVGYSSARGPMGNGFSGRKQPPQDINFAIDGGDSRGNNSAQGGSQGGQFGGFGGFDGNGGDYSMFGSDQNITGMLNMGNNMMNGMGNNMMNGVGNNMMNGMGNNMMNGMGNNMMNGMGNNNMNGMGNMMNGMGNNNMNGMGNMMNGMGNNNMNGMMIDPMNNSNNGRNNGNIDMSFNKILEERSKLDSMNGRQQAPKNFNPMNSPQIMNGQQNMNMNMNQQQNMNFNGMNNGMNMYNGNGFGNNLNFRLGGINNKNNKEEGMSNNNVNQMNSNQIQNLINGMKTDAITFSPEQLQHMDSKQMGNVINQLKTGSGYGNVSKNTSKTDKSKNIMTKEKKSEILEMVQKMKKINAEKEKLLKNTIKKPDKNKKQHIQEYEDSPSNDEEIIEQSESEHSEIQSLKSSKSSKSIISTKSSINHQKDIKSTNSTKSINNRLSKQNCKILTINSSEYGEPEFYNDYLVELSDPVKNIACIEITDYKFPKPNKKITINENNNQFVFDIDEEQTIELEEGEFNINDIIEATQNIFEQNDINIQLSITPDNRVVIKSNNEFILKNESGSILKSLGFTKKIYKNKSKYIAESCCINSSRLYLFIDNISTKDPIGMIELDKKEITPIRKEFKTPIDELTDILLKFKTNNTEDNDLYDFNEEPHVLTLKLESAR
jgi:hypothetical protein